MKSLRKLAVVIVALGSVSVAQADVITFDDTGDSGPGIPAGYGGFNWEKLTPDGATAFRILDVTSILSNPDYAGTGYLNSLVSSDFVAFNNHGDPAWMSSITGPFDFNGVYFTAAIRDGLNIAVNGYLDGSLLYSSTVVVDTTSPSWFEFNYSGVDELSFTSFGGTVAPGAPFPDSTDPRFHFAMDNFTFNATSVPEPSTLALLGLGLAGMGLARCRKSGLQS